jgi:hypothetical protein
VRSAITRVLFPRAYSISAITGGQDAAVTCHSVFGIEGQRGAAVGGRIAVAVMGDADSSLLII